MKIPLHRFADCPFGFLSFRVLSLYDTLVCALVAVALSFGAPASLLAVHPFHISSAELEFNAKSGRFEVALRLQVVDLEKVVQMQAGQRVDLETPAAEKIIVEYLSRNFYIANASTGDSSNVGAEVQQSPQSPQSPQSSQRTVAELHKSSEPAESIEAPTSADERFKRPVAVSEVPPPPKSKVQLVGKEFQTSWVWLYFEMDAPASGKATDAQLSDLVFVNRVLTEVNSGQINTCTIRYGNQRQSLKMSNSQLAFEFDRKWMQPVTGKATTSENGKQPASKP